VLQIGDFMSLLADWDAGIEETSAP